MNRIVKQLATRNRKDFAPSANLAAVLGNGEIAYGSAQALAVKDGVNEKDCSVTFTICTIDEDREGDVVHPRGCLDFLNDYRRNPVVLYEHDAKAGGIGLSAHKSHGFQFNVTPDRIVAKCFYHLQPFHGENLSLECWELARRGYLLGASIGFLPVESQPRSRFGKGVEFTKWRITEWSQTFQPVNAGTLNEDVLRMSLSRGIIKSTTLKRRVAEILPPGKVWSPGATLKGIGSGGGQGTIHMSSKPKTAAIEFDTEVFNANTAAAWLKSHGYRSDAPEHLPNSMIFTQRAGVILAGSNKSLGKGVWALLTKSADEKEEDKVDESPVEGEETKSEETSDDPVVEEPEAENEEATDEEVDEAPDEIDSEALKGHAQLHADLVGHFKQLIESKDRLAGGHPELAESYAKIVEYAEKMLPRLKKDFADKFAEVALESMIGGGEPEAEEVPDPVEPATAAIDDEDEILKALAKAGKEAKSFVRNIKGAA